jgi:transcription elongation factor/antiterminator RfaH
MENWYTLYTKPNVENRVAAFLDEHEIETYVPKIWDPRKSTKEKLVPFFPCYLFMRIDLDRTASSQWQWTPGLRHIVAFDGDPVPVSDQVIDLIRRKLDELNRDSGRPQQKFKPGEVVRITHGPFAELLALFDGPTTPAERVTVLLDFLGRFSRVRLNITDLEKVSERTEIAPPKRPRRTRGRGRWINYSP